MIIRKLFHKLNNKEVNEYISISDICICSIPYPKTYEKYIAK